MTLHTSGVLQKAARSVKWSTLSEIVSRTVPPLVFVVLAKLLTPEDYGVVGTAMIAISFCQMFWDAGLSKALVQTKDSPLDAAHVVFWTNLLLGLAIYAVLFAGAPWIADFFHSPKSALVLRVLGLQVVLASLTSVQQALLVRDMGFQRLFWVKLITSFVPGVISIPLAIFGKGVWALVAGTLIGQTVNLVLMWELSSWRPRWQYDSVLARKLFGFGLWVVLESFGAWLMIWGDSVIVGRYLGVHDLGVYRTGVMMVMIVFGLALNPIVPILFPTFARLQDDVSSLRSVFHRVNRMVIAFALPIGTGSLLVGSEAAAFLFGDKWNGLGQVLSVLGFSSGLSWTVCLNTEVYRAMGISKMAALIMWLHLVIYLPAYWMSAHYGLQAFLFTRLGLVLVGAVIHVAFFVNLLRVSPFYLWHEGKAMILGAAAMAVVVLAAKAALFQHAASSPGWLVLALLVPLGTATYIVAVWRLDPQFVLSLKGMLERVAKS